MTDDLVHFIRGPSVNEAVPVLQKILAEKRLNGGTGFIKGSFRCVCFSEAPVYELGYAHQRGIQGGRYQPVGVLVKKKWLFAQGGRPVIYQPDSDYSLLPDELRWRHVRLEPDKSIDWTWEREWRIRTAELRIDPTCAQIVVPNDGVAAHLRTLHDAQQDIEEGRWAEAFDELWAMQMREDFMWRVVSLDLPPVL